MVKVIVKYLVKAGIAIFSVGTLIGCAHQYFPKPDDPRFAPIIPSIEAEPKPKGGSAYIDGYGLNLYQDIKALRVGDIITVKLVEETKASKDAKTNYKKGAAHLLPEPTIAGRTLSAHIPGLHSDNKMGSLATTVNNSSEFKSSGDSGQNNSLNGDITVTISQVLPNRNLVIRGEKWLTLNQGSEYIRLTGIVRPDDIGPNNVVISTRIANARITYSGTGEIADATKSGWLSRFFTGPVWPF